MKIALFQETAVPLNLHHNLKMMERAAKKASNQGAKLMLTPELFTTGYAPALIREHVSRSMVSEAVETLANIAHEHKLALAFSLPGIEANDQRGICATLVDAEGEVRANYQKVHLFGAEEKAAFQAGTKPPPVIRYRDLNIALMVCYDVEFPELVRSAAINGADILLVPTALQVGAEQVSKTLVPARALENGITVAYANHAGVEADIRFSGGSVVAGPLGHQVIATTQPDLIFAEIAPSPQPGPEGPWYLEDRQGELYKEWL